MPLLAYFGLMRPVNVAIAALGTASACVLGGAGLDDAGLVLLASAASACITAGGNADNDANDVAIDRINRPGRVLARGAVTQRGASVFSVICISAGLGFAAVSGLPPFLIAVTAVALIHAYNMALKHVPLLGNAAVALVTGMAFPFGAAAAGDGYAGIVPGLFAFAFTMPREIFKDIEDMKGDSAAEVRTYPIAHGADRASRLAALCCVTIVAASPLPWFFSLYSIWYLVVVLAGVAAPLAYIALRAWRLSGPADAGRFSVVMKLAMPLGIFAFLAGTFL